MTKLSLVALSALVLAAGCGDDVNPSVPIYDETAVGNADSTLFFNLPFPSDLRRESDGHLNLAGFPTKTPLVEQYVAATAKLDGFGLSSGMYVRMTGPVDETSLPTPASSLTDEASLFLIDIDPNSSRRGERTPVNAHFTATGYATLPGNLLAALPTPGFPLQEGTTYALVVTDLLRSGDGSPVEPSPGFVVARDAALYLPLWNTLAEHTSVAKDSVVVATVFTTQHATQLVPLLREVIWQLPAPTAIDLEQLKLGGVTTRFVGSYQAPNFQSGTVPYSSNGGDIKLDDNGLPIIQVTETLRMAVTIPDGPTPATGWPIALYEHGTGGDYLSFASDGTGERLGAEGIAVISMDQVLHGPRNPGGNPEISFFNVNNPMAVRDNTIQGAADGFSLLRLAAGLNFTDDDGRAIFIDPERIYFFGHSQGSLTGVPFVAFEPSIKAAVFSGAGAVLYLSLLNKTEPLDIPALVTSVTRDLPLDPWTPTLTLVQTWTERSDAMNYAELLTRAPPLMPAPDGGPGDGTRQAPKSVFQTDGIVDSYAPNVSGRALFVGIGGDQLEPVLEPIEGLVLRGRTPQLPPLANNLNGATVALGQYVGDEGHFVVFDVATARRQAHQFLSTHASTGTATVVP